MAQKLNWAQQLRLDSAKLQLLGRALRSGRCDKKTSDLDDLETKVKSFNAPDWNEADKQTLIEWIREQRQMQNLL